MANKSSNDPYDISQDDEFIKEQKITELSGPRRSARFTGGVAKGVEGDTGNDKSKSQENFQCGACDRFFVTFEGRQRHMGKCSQLLVKQEMTDVTADGKCKCCDQNIRTAHKEGELECADCLGKFKTKPILVKHRMRTHDREINPACPECKQIFPDTAALAQHMYSHTEDKPFSCDRCGVMFTRRYHLLRHVRQTGCDGVNRLSFKCQVCGKVFSRKDNLREHLRAHAGVNKRRAVYECEFCNETITGHHSYIIHKKVHTGNKPFKCTHCEKHFSTSGAQKKHIRTHTGERPYQCKECGNRFAAKEILNRHMKLHTGVRPFKCSYCSKGFIQASQLKAHTFYHSGENGYKCDECDKAFNRKSRLDLHKKFVHEGAELLKCALCDKSFYRKEDLKRHEIVHSGVRAFQCDVCSKSFTVKSALRMHALTHTKETPRACNYCNRAFIRQDCLLRHMRAKHREKLAEILIEAERKKLQLQLLTISNETKSKTNDSTDARVLNGVELSESVNELLKLLVDEETLCSFGSPNAPVDQVLCMVIKRCGHRPIENKNLEPIDRLRENAKLLFTVVIDDKAVKTLLNNQSVDEVILHVLNLAKS